MRPKRLEFEGFASFRESTIIDFDEADLFALAGPTGAGKSSILDGIVFALYGNVPRYGDERLVAPVITQGKNEAKVALDFTIGGVEYRATRVVRRTSGNGAATKEARLERGESVLAGDARGVGAEIERLIGLSYAQFTKCILLPQGDFAKFLHDKPADRQALLRKLLNIEVYERMGTLARHNAKIAQGSIGAVDRQIEGLEEATEENLKSARIRLDALKSTHIEVVRLTDERDKVEIELSAENTSRQKLRDDIERLEILRIPEDVQGVASKLADLEGGLKDAVQSRDEAEGALSTHLAKCSELPEQAVLEARERDFKDLRLLEAEFAGKETEAAKAAKDLDVAHTDLEKLESEREQAEGLLEERKRLHLAYNLAQDLTHGSQCPVCAGTFNGWTGSVPDGIAEAEKRWRAAHKAKSDAEAKVVSLRTGFAVLENGLSNCSARRDAIVLRLQEGPSQEETVAGIAKVKAAIALTAQLGKARDEALKLERQVRVAMEQAKMIEQKAVAEHDQVLLSFATLNPPTPSRKSLAEDWEALSEWAAAKAKGLMKSAAEIDGKLTALHSKSQEITQSIESQMIAVGIESKPRAEREACAAAIAKADAAHTQLETSIRKVVELRKELASLKEKEQLFSEIGRLLMSNNFEAWFLARTFAALSGSASTILQQLSSGQYSIAFQGNSDFEVVDHSNADERRPVKTLSGGETFLASLALALALSEQVAQSAGTHVRLESLFLDEGFGTLDPETLEVVASAVEELGASGRMIGIITHVREFAERVPVRFEVRKGSRTSTVERIAG